MIYNYKSISSIQNGKAGSQTSIYNKNSSIVVNKGSDVGENCLFSTSVNNSSSQQATPMKPTHSSSSSSRNPHSTYIKFFPIKNANSINSLNNFANSNKSSNNQNIVSSITNSNNIYNSSTNNGSSAIHQHRFSLYNYEFSPKIPLSTTNQLLSRKNSTNSKLSSGHQTPYLSFNPGSCSSLSTCNSTIHHRHTSSQLPQSQHTTSTNIKKNPHQHHRHNTITLSTFSSGAHRASQSISRKYSSSSDTSSAENSSEYDFENSGGSGGRPHYHAHQHHSYAHGHNRDRRQNTNSSLCGASKLPNFGLIASSTTFNAQKSHINRCSIGESVNWRTPRTPSSGNASVMFNSSHIKTNVSSESLATFKHIQRGSKIFNKENYDNHHYLYNHYRPLHENNPYARAAALMSNKGSKSRRMTLGNERGSPNPIDVRYSSANGHHLHQRDHSTNSKTYYNSSHPTRGSNISSLPIAWQQGGASQSGANGAGDDVPLIKYSKCTYYNRIECSSSEESLNNAESPSKTPVVYNADSALSAGQANAPVLLPPPLPPPPPSSSAMAQAKTTAPPTSSGDQWRGSLYKKSSPLYYDSGIGVDIGSMVVNQQNCASNVYASKEIKLVTTNSSSMINASSSNVHEVKKNALNEPANAKNESELIKIATNIVQNNINTIINPANAASGLSYGNDNRSDQIKPANYENSNPKDVIYGKENNDKKPVQQQTSQPTTKQIQTKMTQPRRFYCETLNPTLMRKLNDPNLSVLNLVSSSSQSSSTKIRRTLDTILNLNKNNPYNFHQHHHYQYPIDDKNLANAQTKVGAIFTASSIKSIQSNYPSMARNSSVETTGANDHEVIPSASTFIAANGVPIVKELTVPSVPVSASNESINSLARCHGPSNEFKLNEARDEMHQLQPSHYNHHQSYSQQDPESIKAKNPQLPDAQHMQRKDSLLGHQVASSCYTKADFTPHLIKNNLVKTNSVKRKCGLPNPLASASSNSNSGLGKSPTNPGNGVPSTKGEFTSNSINPASLYAENQLVDNQAIKSSRTSESNLASSIKATKNLLVQMSQGDSSLKVTSTSTTPLGQAGVRTSKNVNSGQQQQSQQSQKQMTNGGLPTKDQFYGSTSFDKKAKVESQNSFNSKQLKQMANISATKVTTSDKKCVALNDYIALYSKNLSLKKGEKYTLLSNDNQNWSLVRDKYGNSGFAPTNYLHYLSNEKLNQIDKSHYEKEWFHSNLTRSQAYLLLTSNQNENGTFLMRNNSSEKGKYTLCILKSGKVYNYKVNCQDEKLFITQKNKFNNLVELVEFYKKNAAGLVCALKYPAEKGTLEKKGSFENTDFYKKFTIERKDIEFFEKIGSGQFGVVLKAEYKQRKIVAVKKMKPGSKDDEINFNREAEFMMKLQNLQELQHRNLVQFFGVSKDFDNSILIVTEFVKYGSLYNYLLKHKDRIINSKSRTLRLLNICIDVCDGMEYLESKHVVHRDLATRNCLVGEGEVIKVADFGLARFTDDYYIAHPQSQFPVKWSAPEVIKYRSYSSKSDVWSFSCLMYEVFTLGKMPYGGNTTNSAAAKQIIAGIVPEKPTYCPTSLYENVLSKAWSKDPKERPSFKELLKILNDLTY